ISIFSEDGLLLASLRRRRRAIGLKRADTARMKFGVGDRAAFELHALGSEGGIAAHHLIVGLALANVRGGTRVGWYLLGVDGCGNSDQQRGSRYYEFIARHSSVPSCPTGIGWRFNPPSSSRR